MTTSVYAIFRDTHAAQRAVDALMTAHFDVAEIRVLTRSSHEVHPLPVTMRMGFRRSVPVGVVVGAVLGCILAPFGALASLGPWLAVLTGGLIGAAIGAFVGALGGLSFWSEKIEFPHTKGWHHAVLVGVETSSAKRVVAAERALHDAGAHDVTVRSSGAVESTVH